MYINSKAFLFGINIHQHYQRMHYFKIITERRKSHNYIIVVQLFLIKREFDTPIPVELEFLP